MNLVMVSSEAVPYVKSGGLADVTGSLATTLAKREHQVSLFLPAYSFIDLSGFKELPLPISVELGLEKFSLRLFQGKMSDGDVDLYFISHPFFTDRHGIYGIDGGHQYRDNSLRFALFNRAVIEALLALGTEVDIFHLHDWQAGLIPAFLKRLPEKANLANAATIFTIHNIGYQGLGSKYDIQALGLYGEDFTTSSFGYGEQSNMLRSALIHSDHISTVSPTYTREVLSAEFGEGLEDLLNKRKDAFTGILNGVDYDEWNPAEDPHLSQTFSLTDMSGKARAKADLQALAELPIDPDVPLIGMVGRLADQKGFGELLRKPDGALERLLSQEDLQFVILGTGSSWIEEALLRLSQEYGSLALFLTFSEELAHQVEGGSDFFLMPSRYEPCGLNQIYSLKYGAIPIVRETGGLKDTVRPYTGKESGKDDLATGFSFPDSDPDQIIDTVKQALHLYHSERKTIEKIRENGMKEHFSWDDSAARYEELYKRLSSRS
jgi:starch synthase